MPFKLKVISSSVRPGRKGIIIADWITQLASLHGEFEVELLDLGVINLPMMNEPAHPRLKTYIHQHTKQWSAKIDEAEALIFVTAEYDYNYPAPLRNALEYLVEEWAYKAAGIISYGGVSAGTRAWNSLKGDLSAFRIVPLMETVNLPFFTQYIDENGVFTPNAETVKAAGQMLNELVRWTKGLKLIRENNFG